MLGLFKKKSQGLVARFKIEGMHCTSCSMNIDGELEDTDGVISASTSYAKAVTEVEFAPDVISKSKIKAVIEKLDYQVSEIN